ncbi:MAG: hypothetical protein LC647_06450, partial [Beggiatoa sp.]|nr:hypothetical protein [Beggiatoa sp.]
MIHYSFRGPGSSRATATSWPSIGTTAGSPCFGVTLRQFEPTRVEHGGKPAMITMDGDDHVRNRRIVARGFTPTVVGAFEKRLRDLSTAVLDKALAERQVDFVHSVAVPMPLHAICDLRGIPDEDRKDVLRWCNAFAVPTDPDYA